MSGGGSLLIGGLFAGVGAGVGSLFGNPKIGAELGFMVGGAIGGSLFEDNERIAPERLVLEKVGAQISTYGAPVPVVYGNARLKGNIIWAGKQTSTLSEDRTEYSYSRSFAVAICEGEVGGIRKMWADSKLLFDQSLITSLSSQLQKGKYADDITFYNGTQTTADPLMVAEEGVENVPIYKNISYVVFTELSLAPYGNRVPNIEVEVAESAEIIGDLNFPPDGDLHPTSIEILSGDIYVSYSEKEYNELGYTTPKIKKMIGISNTIDFEIEIDVETIKSFKFFNNGVKFITAPIDFVLDVGATGTENDITNYEGAIYTYDGLFVQKINYSDRKISSTVWFEGLTYEKTITELNGFIVEDIEIIKDEKFKEDGWLEAVLRNEYTDANVFDAILGNEFILVTGTKWWFDTENKWDEQPPGSTVLIGKEHLYSAPFMKVYGDLGDGDSVIEFLGDQFMYQVIDAMSDYSTLYDTSTDSRFSVVADNIPHEGYKMVHIDYVRYASGGRASNHFFSEPIDKSGSEITDDWILPGSNNNGYQINSAFFTTRQLRTDNLNINFDKIPMWIWLTTAIITDGLPEKKQVVHFFNNGKDNFDMINTPSPVSGDYWDVTDMFPGAEYIINMSKYEFEDKLHILFISNLGNTRVIREGAWIISNNIGTGEDYKKINFERFIANNVFISDIIADLMDTAGITSYDLTEIDDIEIGGYLRDKSVTPSSMIKPLMAAFLFDIIEVDWVLKAVLKKDTVDVVLDENYISAYENESKDDFTETLMDRNKLPNVTKVTFTDIQRDYKANTKTAQWIDRSVNEELNIKLPFIISPIQAKQIAEKILQFLQNTRGSFTFSSTVKYLYLMPNDVVTLGDKTMRITNVDLDIPNRLRYQATEIRAGMFENNSLTIPNPDSQDDPASTLSDVGYILIHTHSLRKDNDGGYYIAAFSVKTWAGAGIYIGNTGQNMNLVASVGDESDIGVLVNSIEKAISVTTFDYGTSIVVNFMKPARKIRSVDQSVVLGYQNMIVVGSGNKWEIISYQTATNIIGNQWELKGLIRGINGTDIYDYSHGIGSYVIPVDSLIHIPLENSQVKKYLYMKVLPPVFGTTNTYTEKIIALGRILDVWGVSDINAYRFAGDWFVTWKFRTRVNGEWKDYTDIIDIDVNSKFIIEFFQPNVPNTTFRYSVVDTLEFKYSNSSQNVDWGTTLVDLGVRIYQYNNYSEVVSKDHEFNSLYL